MEDVPMLFLPLSLYLSAEQAFQLFIYFKQINGTEAPCEWCIMGNASSSVNKLMEDAQHNDPLMCEDTCIDILTNTLSSFQLSCTCLTFNTKDVCKLYRLMTYKVMFPA